MLSIHLVPIFLLILPAFSISFQQDHLDAQSSRDKRSITNDQRVLWPSKFIPMIINPNIYNVVVRSTQFWSLNTCLTIHEANLTSTDLGLNFTRAGSGCWSAIGMMSQLQHVSVDPGCNQYSIVTALVGRALGVISEHNRSDRDEHITIEWANVNSTAIADYVYERRAFRGMNDYVIGYDYASGLHASGFEYSKNGQRTITTRDPNYQSTIGSIEGPSFNDVRRVNRVYCHDLCGNMSTTCHNGGYHHPKDCLKCICPPPFEGRYCEDIQTGPNCTSSALTANDNVKTVSANGNKTCAFVITAPGVKQVSFEITAFNITSTGTIVKQGACLYNYLEINYRTDLTLGGARFCGSTIPTITVSRSTSQKLILIFKGKPGSRFSLNYQAV